ncbi:MAG: sulfatase [Acidobacteriota bacterium]|nr:sulfatase [Acidobacteriota bacterium]
MRSLIVLLTLSACTQAVSAPERPNVVLVLVDDLGYSDVGFNGATFYETPNIDALAGDGMVLSDFYAGGANCSPTRASLMTGMYTPRHHNYTPGGKAKGNVREMRFAVPTRGVSTPLLDAFPSFNGRLDPAHTSVAEILAAAGYATARIGKWHLGRDTQGFAVSLHDRPHGREAASPPEDAERLTDAALDFLEQNRLGPFFLYLAYHDVHSPLRARQEVVARYQAKLATSLDVTYRWSPVYAAMIEAVDTQVGRLRAKLEELGLAEHTLFMFSSDNGGSTYSTTNRPLKGGKGSFFEGGIRVPTCIAWPAVIEPGSRSAVPLTSVDLMPTLAEIAGAALPTGQPVDGESFVAVLAGGRALERESIFWHYPLYLAGGDRLLPIYGTETRRWRAVPSSAIRKGDFKLIYYYEYDDYKLFDLREDVSEEHDLAAKMPARADELLTELRAWVRDTGAPVPNRPNPAFAPLPPPAAPPAAAPEDPGNPPLHANVPPENPRGASGG